MKFKSSLLIIILILCVFFVGCTKNDEISGNEADNINGTNIGNELKNVLPAPDKILIYSNGKTKKLDKNSSEYKKVVQLTEKRFHDKICSCQDIINDSIMKFMRRDGLGIEFLYNKEQELSIKNKGFEPFKYYKLYFQLTSEKYGNEQGSMVHTLQYGDKKHYKNFSRGPLKYSEKLVKLVKELK